MAFEVIPGGLCFEDDIPAPDKPIEEWTEEEKAEYERYCFENSEPGSAQAAIKEADISPEVISATIDALEAIRTVCSKEAEATGFRDEWPHVMAEDLLTWLHLRKQLEEKRPQQARKNLSS